MKRLAPIEALRERLRAIASVLEQRPLAASVHHVGVSTVNERQRGISLNAMHARRRAVKARGFIGAAAAARVDARRLLREHGALVVHLVRLAPRGLDDDNLAGAFKAVRDGFARQLGVDDRDSRVRYVTSEEAAREPGVRVEVYPLLPEGVATWSTR